MPPLLEVDKRLRVVGVVDGRPSMDDIDEICGVRAVEAEFELVRNVEPGVAAALLDVDRRTSVDGLDG